MHGLLKDSGTKVRFGKVSLGVMVQSVPKLRQVSKGPPSKAGCDNDLLGSFVGEKVEPDPDRLVNGYLHHQFRV